MREIKFRAWDPTYKQIFYQDNLRVFHISGRDSWTLEDKVQNKCIAGCGTGILMQFTGLFDRHGNEIWEGDTVKREGEYKEPILREVIYSDGRFIPLVRVEYGYNAIDNFDPSLWEVIGNIYENPELLNDHKNA